MSFFEILESVFTLSLVYSAVRVSTSIVLAGMGEMITERAGVLNIGLEGIMLMGAWSAAIATYFTGNPWIGLLAAAGTGLVIALIFAFIVITLKSNQAITGLAMFLLCAGLSGFLLQIIFEHGGNTPSVNTLPNVNSAFLENIPILGEIFNGQSILVFPTLLLPILLSILFYKTHWGTWLRAAGENPRALDVVGVNPIAVRYIATLTGGVLCGVGGAYLSISQTSLFSENMVAGRGFIALAAVIFGNVRPGGVFWACMFFGFMDALQLTLQTVVPDYVIPREVFMSLPYIITVLILAGFIRRKGGPADVGNPYIRES